MFLSIILQRYLAFHVNQRDAQDASSSTSLSQFDKKKTRRKGFNASVKHKNKGMELHTASSTTDLICSNCAFTANDRNAFLKHKHSCKKVRFGFLKFYCCI